MKKLSASLVLAALVVGTLAACAPDPTAGIGIPAELQQLDGVESVSAVKPDAISGVGGIVYIVEMEGGLNSQQVGARANEITAHLADITEKNDNWGIRFRSGNMEIGMSQAAFVIDNPSYEPPSASLTSAPEQPLMPVPTPEPGRDSYAQQIVAANEILKSEGALFVKTYDALNGYVDVSIADQGRLEEFFGVAGNAIDLSDWKHRGDFKLSLSLVEKYSGGILKPTGVTVSAELNVVQAQEEGLSKLLRFPQIAVAMYRATLPLKDVSVTSVLISSRGLHEDIFVIYEGEEGVGVNLSTAIRTVKMTGYELVDVNVTRHY